MTIKEIEEQSGMTRSNIRFYEYEGLLTPERADNDYRNYSEADLATLLKIKLLRQLQVPLEDIRKLQTGALALSDALDDRLRQLGQEMTGLQSSEEICRDIKASNSTYSDLDAQKYLSRTGAAAQFSPDRFSIRSDDLPKVNHPWRRYFARSLDYTVYSILWSAIAHLALHWNTALAGLFEQYILALIAFVIMLFIEPLMLSTWGSTPGKWIFGLEVRASDGTMLSYSGALWRTWGVFHHGYGYFIPFYNVYRHYKSYKACRDNEELPWDEDIAYTLRDTKGLRIAGYLAANLLIVGVLVCILLQAEMPRHRGTLTASEFSENFNSLMDYYRIDYGKHLDDSGKWTQDPSDGSTFVINLSNIPIPDFEITETDGDVTKVSFEVTANDQMVLLDEFTVMMQLAMKSYVCAQRDVNLFSQGSVVRRENTAFTDFDFSKGGVRVKNDVTYEGYHVSGSNTLFPDSNEKKSFHLVFSMEKTA